jgi:hypothetical protein
MYILVIIIEVILNAACFEGMADFHLMVGEVTIASTIS